MDNSYEKNKEFFAALEADDLSALQKLSGEATFDECNEFINTLESYITGSNKIGFGHLSVYKTLLKLNDSYKSLQHLGIVSFNTKKTRIGK